MPEKNETKMKNNIKIEFMKLLNDPNRFQKLDDGWVRDKLVGVEWGPSSDKYLTFKQAKEYCSKLGGCLPEVNELQSIVDYTKCYPAIDKTLFPDTKSSWYWTGTDTAWSKISHPVWYGMTERTIEMTTGKDGGREICMK